MGFLFGESEEDRLAREKRERDQIAIDRAAEAEELQRRQASYIAQQEAERKRAAEEAATRYQQEIEAQERSLARGRELAGEYFREGSLGRVQTERTPESQQILGARQQAFRDAGTRTQGVADILAQRAQTARTAGTRSGTVSDVLAQRQSQVGKQQELANQQEVRSADTSDVLARRKDALSGMSSEETNARRAAFETALGRQQQTAQRSLLADQAARGVRGGSAIAQQSRIAGEFNKERAAQERDLFLADLGLRRQALGDFESSVRGIEGEEFGRRSQALAQLSGATGALEGSARAAETEEIARREGALGSLESSLVGAEQREGAAKSASLSAYEAALRQAEQDQLSREMFNIGQRQREVFGGVSTQLGFSQMDAATRQSIMDQIIAQQQLSASQNPLLYAPLSASTDPNAPTAEELRAILAQQAIQGALAAPAPRSAGMPGFPTGGPTTTAPNPNY